MEPSHTPSAQIARRRRTRARCVPDLRLTALPRGTEETPALEPLHTSESDLIVAGTLTGVWLPWTGSHLSVDDNSMTALILESLFSVSWRPLRRLGAYQ